MVTKKLQNLLLFSLFRLWQVFNNDVVSMNDAAWYGTVSVDLRFRELRAFQDLIVYGCRQSAGFRFQPFPERLPAIMVDLDGFRAFAPVRVKRHEPLINLL